MNKLLIVAALAFAVGSACAQANDAASRPNQAADAKADATTNSLCLRDTGSHIPPTAAQKNATRAADCARGPGRSYSKDELDRTGATDTADALRRIDPSLTVVRH